MFTRMRQKIKEKTGRASCTRYSAEFEDQSKLVKLMREHTEDMVHRMKTTVTPFDKPAGKDANSTERLGESFRALGEKLPKNSTYTRTLKSGSQACNQICELEHRMVGHVQEHVCLPLAEWLNNDAREMIDDRKQLEKRRLEMDDAVGRLAELQGAKRSKAMEPPSNKQSDSQQGTSNQPPPRTKLEAAEQRMERKSAQHDQQLRRVQGWYGRLDDYSDHHRRCVLKYLEFQLEFMQDAIDVIDDKIKHK